MVEGKDYQSVLKLIAENLICNWIVTCCKLSLQISTGQTLPKRKKKSHFTVEKPGKHHLNWHHVPSNRIF